MNVVYTQKALDHLSKLPKKTADRIFTKMLWFASQKKPLSFAKTLKDTTLGQYRFRVGDYRVLVEVHKDIVKILFVLSVAHRKDVYRL